MTLMEAQGTDTAYTFMQALAEEVEDLRIGVAPDEASGDNFWYIGSDLVLRPFAGAPTANSADKLEAYMVGEIPTWIQSTRTIGFPTTIMDLPIKDGATHNTVRVTSAYTVPTGEAIALVGYFTEVTTGQTLPTTYSVDGINLSGVTGPWSIIVEGGKVIQTNQNTIDHLLVIKLKADLVKGVTLQPGNTWTPPGASKWMIVDSINGRIQNNDASKVLSMTRGKRYILSAGSDMGKLSCSPAGHISLMRVA